MSRPQVAILAGGLGLRLRPITEKIPKPMVEVAGKPFLHWQLEDLKSQGYTKILLLVAYLGEQIEKYFGDGSSRGLQIQYSYESEPLGTGGALKLALDKLDEEFLLVNGDSFLSAPLDEMTKVFREKKFEALVSTYGGLEQVPVVPNLKVTADRVTAYQKDAGLKHGFDHIDSGVYLLKREIVNAHPGTRFALADLWPPLIERKKLGAFAVEKRFYDIGTPERLAEFEAEIGRLSRNPGPRKDLQ